MPLGKFDPLNVKVWFVVGITMAGAIIIAQTTRRRRRKVPTNTLEYFGAFVERFELLGAPQPLPPAAPLLLSGLSFAISDNFDIKGQVTGFGNPDWRKTHGPADQTALIVTVLRKKGAGCIGRTVIDEFSFGMKGENLHYGMTTNPDVPTDVPGGSCSGSAVAVAAGLVDFALGSDTIGGVRIPASFCGVLGFRPSHAAVCSSGMLPNSQSLDAIGWLARNPAVLHRVGSVLLPVTAKAIKRTRHFIFADDCFQLSNVPIQKTVNVISNSIESLSGFQAPKHMNISQYIASNVPSLKEFYEPSSKSSKAASSIKALSTVMLLLQRYEFKTNYEDWINTVKPSISLEVSARVLEAINYTPDHLKSLYNVRTELRAALNTLLKDGGILLIPTTAAVPLKHGFKQKLSAEYQDSLYTLLSIAGVSGCCQATVPLGKHDSHNISVSFVAAHGADRFLLDTILDMYSSIQEQVVIASSYCLPAPQHCSNGDLDQSEVLKEKGNAAFRGKHWKKAVNYYSDAIKLNNANAKYYCNRAAAYLELGCYQQAETDCTHAISLDKKIVKAYMRRGTAREMLLYYKEALQDFRYALALEPQNKAARAAEKRIEKLLK
ncbi:Glutamyl-tRNA(Gln) amidotransferase subunit A [Rhynchospora pubera]|uniref:Glutamyl-tRNA(Gln) amidotransferase subunit A n=1 Tax=Rhynchospora pubera TaxID=906938 RepID=A0AAV8FAH9_9POAL|nr:Glutamyl-tRNA(Gln) amidotransferase subunit A [Rhynchospora pubera]